MFRDDGGLWIWKLDVPGDHEVLVLRVLPTLDDALGALVDVRLLEALVFAKDIPRHATNRCDRAASLEVLEGMWRFSTRSRLVHIRALRGLRLEDPGGLHEVHRGFTPHQYRG